MRRRRRISRGQAAVEMAIIFPLLFLLVLGAADFGRAIDLQIEITGASRAGMRTGVAGGTNDIGIAVRGEPNSAIADTDANWGLEGKSVANTYNCSGLSTKCGDPNGCAPSSFTAGQIVCFSVRACPHVGTSYPTSSCSSSWGVRPAVGSNDAIDVIVVYKYATMTTLIAGFVPGGIFYLTGETRAVESY